MLLYGIGIVYPNLMQHAICSVWLEHIQVGIGRCLRKAPVPDYNQNQDRLTTDQVKAWYDFWRVRPGMGERVSSGGVKICFTESNTYGRSEFNYRVSGVMDAMRIAKPGYKAHQVMWSGWVENDKKQTAIIGHWNYQPDIKKDIYVISNSPVVELFVNGKSVGKAEAEHDFVHTIKNVEWERGSIRAVGLDRNGNTESEDVIETAEKADHLQLTLIKNPCEAKTITIKQTGATTSKDGYSGIIEVAAPTAGELDLYKTPGSDKVNSELRIVEIDFLQKIDAKSEKHVQGKARAITSSRR